MALTIGQKASRVLKLLRGVRKPRVYGALAAHGFAKADLEEGWSLLRGASDAKLDLPHVSPAPPEVYEQLDEWENKWFPIIQATLVRSYPAVASRIFLNLRQTSGVEVSVSVNTFLTRFRALEQSGAADDRAAVALLNRRGLTSSVLGVAEGLLSKLEDVPDTPLPVEPSPEDIAQAEDALWSWYLEWSTIARNVVHDRRLLRALGFLTQSGAPVSDDEPTEEDIADEGDATAVAAE